MSGYANNVGVKVPRVLLPKKDGDFYKWAVVACDQFTSQPEYWEEAAKITKGSPSALNLILPEAYLNKPGEEDRILAIKRAMQSYLNDNLLQEMNEGFILVKRQVGGKERLGLVLALDLEQYDYNKGATTLIRATEGTIVDRIPPRLRIREGAAMELPHILVLIDDKERTVIEPLANSADAFSMVYDTPLMLDGGHITGYLVDNPLIINGVLKALEVLMDERAFKEKYGEEYAPMLYAMGDGNHSFATAKAAWENIKKTLSKEEQQTHPARYALVEIENVHDEGIVFEPIHRVVFGLQPLSCLNGLCELLNKDGQRAEIISMEKEEDLLNALKQEEKDTHKLPYYYTDKCGYIRVNNPAQQLEVGTLQKALDELLKKQGEVDYIHGKDVLLSLVQKEEAIGFLLPAMEKSQLFKTVVYDGALPRKTFSMGEANEKRYYMECRKILP